MAREARAGAERGRLSRGASYPLLPTQLAEILGDMFGQIETASEHVARVETQIRGQARLARAWNRMLDAGITKQQTLAAAREASRDAE